MVLSRVAAGGQNPVWGDHSCQSVVASPEESAHQINQVSLPEDRNGIVSVFKGKGTSPGGPWFPSFQVYPIWEWLAREA